MGIGLPLRTHFTLTPDSLGGNSTRSLIQLEAGLQERQHVVTVSTSLSQTYLSSSARAVQPPTILLATSLKKQKASLSS
jgi:hypothetical protein